MSASLVGSEMCIRDSCRSASFAACNLAWKSSQLLTPASSSKLGGSTSSAVSYTHLTLPTICSV
eukprot:9550728-Alexandrium_andersonii.AAC.1